MLPRSLHHVSFDSYVPCSDPTQNPLLISLSARHGRDANTKPGMAGTAIRSFDPRDGGCATSARKAAGSVAVGRCWRSSSPDAGRMGPETPSVTSLPLLRPTYPRRQVGWAKRSVSNDNLDMAQPENVNRASFSIFLTPAGSMGTTRPGTPPAAGRGAPRVPVSTRSVRTRKIQHF